MGKAISFIDKLIDHRVIVVLAHLTIAITSFSLVLFFIFYFKIKAKQGVPF